MVAVQEMQDRSNATRLRELRKITKCNKKTPKKPRLTYFLKVSKTEVEKIFLSFNKVSMNRDTVNYEQFEILFIEQLPWWRFGVEEIFKVTQKTLPKIHF